ncbi:MAG: 4-hydroxythreonine-4-phosphate dehydrogenase PdxA [Gammaproteobacteria bacterium]|nr:4-hydroxythreonine-4-phosphate dehydrogenase PdxA [Gammaproteobacteria bacterium]MDH5302804.1 4-hydroxythreonine-4-phosphate dehydrogenase PdxA [Gammaproteobacteria bacterium]MDH5322364.1 4-hydroxythreonine-4-phosphate dehydrogenase PdxA [Gammaproteobacteria bacterium]
MDPATSRRSLRPHINLKKPIVVTAGEPAGIGPDLCLALARGPHAARLVVVADPEVLRSRAALLGIDFPRKLELLPVTCPEPHVCGVPSPANAGSLLAGLQLAVDGCLRGDFAALVTGPLQKSVINDAGIPFSGHTEFLAELTGTPRPVMLLVAGDLRVALATTHLPLRDVADALSQDILRDVLRILHADLQTRFAIKDPEIIVCGLNPHAGEGGYLGHEDAAVIAPVIREFADRGCKIRGPLPADTAFTPAAGSKDAVLAMYHDQGLPVLKYAGFGHAVNVTLGLPIIRTSVDHGTALDIAGTGDADSGSMEAAIELAIRMALR